MDRTTSLKLTLDQTEASEARFPLLIDLAWEVAVENIEHARLLICEAKELLDSKSLLPPFAEADWATLEAFNMTKKEQYLEALVLAKEAYETYLQQHHPEGLVRVFRVLGLIYGYLGRLDDCIRVSKDGLDLIRQHHLHLTEENGTPLEFVYLNNIATVYTYLGRNEEAIEYYKSALELTDLASDTSWVHINTNLGLTYIDVDEVDLALDCIERSLQLVHEHGLGPTHSQMCHQGFGRAYKKLGRYNDAMDHYRLALAFAKESAIKFNHLDTLIEICRLKVDRGDFESALSDLDQASELGRELQANHLLSQAFQMKAHCYEKLGDQEKALSNYKQYMDIRQSISSKESESLMNAFSTEFRVEKAHQDAELHRMKVTALEEAHHNLTILSEIGRDITSSLDVEQVVKKIYENLSRLMPLDAFAIGLYHRDEHLLEYKILIENGQQLPAYQIHLGNYKGYAGQCIQSREAILLNDIHEQEIRGFLPTDNQENERYPRSIIFQPLLLGTDVMGVITVQSYAAQAYEDRELEVIKILGTYIAIAFNNSQQSTALQTVVKELEIASTVDPLTGLYNRRYMLAQLEQEFERYQRLERPFSVIITDVDHFKTINDSYGHDCGDQVLIEISKLMIDMLRKHDCLARWGGEEFLILLPETPSETAFRIAERLRKAIENHPVVYRDVTVSLTMTFGVAEYRPKTTLEETIQMADRGLYLGKHSGRNRSVVYSE